MIPSSPLPFNAQVSLLNMEQINRLLGAVISSLALQAQRVDDVAGALEVALESWPLVRASVMPTREMLDEIMVAGNAVPPGPVQ